MPAGGGSVQATYKTQYRWTFAVSSLPTDATGTIVVVDGSGYGYLSLPLTFWWDSDSPHSYSYQQYDSSGRVTITVTYGSHTVEIITLYYSSSDTRYMLTQWSDGSTANPRTISVSSDTTLTAYMRGEYRLTVNINPSGGGSVSASPSSSSWFYQKGKDLMRRDECQNL